MQSMSEVYDWGLIDLNIPEAHKKTQGEDITIGIVDTGKSTHFETLPNTKNAKNFSPTNSENDSNGHGTVVAGIIAAAKDNQGIIGVAPQAKLICAKAMSDDGTGNPSNMVKAVEWLTEQNVNIISISSGMFFDFKPLYAAIKKAYDKNITVVAAAGNTANNYYDIAFPARYPEVIGVAAYDKKRQVAEFSSRGINVFCAAPGTDVYSTYLRNSYARMSGTSFSCPLISGVVALILSKHKHHKSKSPCETPAQVMDHLIKYSIKLGEKRDTGYGAIDLNKMFNED